jgi:hypothetical protein
MAARLPKSIPLLVLFAAVVSVVLALLWPRVKAERSEFGAPAEALLKRLAPGSNSPDLRQVAGEVYDQAAPTFQETIIRDHFIDRIVQLNQTMGAVRSVGDAVAEETFESRGGDAVRVDLDAEFEHGRTRAAIAYLRRREDAPYRLLGIEVDIPEARLGYADTVVPTYTSIKTPPAALEKMASILELIEKGEEGKIYERAHPDLRKNLPLSQFIARIAEDRKGLGRFRRILSPVDTGVSMDQTRMRIYALVEYDRARTPALMEFMRDPDPRKDKADDLRLLSYQVVVPDPLQPMRTPEQFRPRK